MKFYRIIILLLNVFLLSCSGNLFLASSNKNSDDALLYDAEMALNSGDWDTAITKITSMSATAQATNEAILLLASAYGGQCGLQAINITNAISGSDPLFLALMKEISNADATAITACINMEDTLDTLSGTLTTSNYIFKVYASMAKIGAIANATADTDDDESVDAGFDGCDTLDLSDTYASHIFTGLSRIITNLNNAGLSGDASLSGVSAICGGACDETDTANVDATDRDVARELLITNDIGINACGGAFGSGGGCACP